MPAYKDEDRGTWFCQFYYKDWDGKRKSKKKRGFDRKKDALEFERDFLNQKNMSTDMAFSVLIDAYMKDMKSRLRESTMSTKAFLITTHIVPHFDKMPINEIKATHIREWQNKLLDSEYSQTYIKTINNQLVAIFNYAVKYYDLPNNPCHKAGTIGKKHADKMVFWTLDEFRTFIEHTTTEEYKMSLKVLFWTGMRLGEMLALTKEDISLSNKIININKSLQRLNKKDIVTEPKTPKSKRVVTIPEFLCNDLELHFQKIYNLKNKQRIFTFTKSGLHTEMKRACKKSNVKKIRVHDIRHSHASLLIEMEFNPLVISERLGHEDIQTTLNTYSHLYPNKHELVADKLNILMPN